MIFEISIVEKACWSGIAAVGFSILFNIPRRIILPLFIVAGIAGAIKFFIIINGEGVILGSLLSAIFIGFGSIPSARNKGTSPFLLSIPSIIPMIPGYFGYEMLLGITQLAMSKNTATYELSVLFKIIHNGLNMLFILLSLSFGIYLPWLLFREKTRKKLRIQKRGDIL